VRAEGIIRRQVWEEEIERRVTASIYDRLFALKSSDDGERDLKLKGKLQGLVVVGVRLEDLGVEFTDREKEFLKPVIEAMGRGTYPPVSRNPYSHCYSFFSFMSSFALGSLFVQVLLLKHFYLPILLSCLIACGGC